MYNYPVNTNKGFYTHFILYLQMKHIRGYILSTLFLAIFLAVIAPGLGSVMKVAYAEDNDGRYFITSAEIEKRSCNVTLVVALHAAIPQGRLTAVVQQHRELVQVRDLI